MKNKFTISEIAQQLRPISDTPHLEAKIILSSVLNQSFTQLALAHDFVLSDQQKLSLDKILRQRLANVPLAYCVGRTEFFNLRIKVLPGVLIPRPETEWLAEFALAQISKSEQKDIAIAEFGIGTAAILCSITTSIQKLAKSYHYFGWDTSALANLNSSQNIESLLADIIIAKKEFTYLLANSSYIHIAETNLLNISDFVTQRLDYFISNPPYIKTHLLSKLDSSVIDHEPLTALDGGEDGLDSYRQIHGLLVQHQQIYSTLPTLILEIDPEIAAAVLRLFADLYANVKLHKDLFGNIRYLTADVVAED